MNATNSSGNTLFPAGGGFVEADYLAFLAQRVPKDIGTQLNGDGQPDLGWSKSIGIDDLMRPLSSHSFPSRELWEMAGILSYTIHCYIHALEGQPARHDPYKLVYAISLYLHCFAFQKCVARQGRCGRLQIGFCWQSKIRKNPWRMMIVDFLYHFGISTSCRTSGAGIWCQTAASLSSTGIAE